MSDQKPTNQQAPLSRNPDEQLHHFLVSAEVEYTDSKFNKTPKYRRVDCIYVCAAGQGISAASLSKIQTQIQLNYHQKRARAGLEPCNILDVVLCSSSFLGTFSTAEFLAGAPGTGGQQATEQAPVAAPSAEVAQPAASSQRK